MDLKKFARSLFHFRGSPHKVALSFSLGVALGVIPGTGAIVAAGVATLFRLNLPVMVAGALITNPLTSPFIYAGSYVLGHWLLGEHLPDSKMGKIFLGTLVGNMVLAFVMSLVAYFVVWGIIRVVRLRLKARRQARLSRHASCA